MTYTSHFYTQSHHHTHVRTISHTHTILPSRMFTLSHVHTIAHTCTVITSSMCSLIISKPRIHTISHTTLTRILTLTSPHTSQVAYETPASETTARLSSTHRADLDGQAQTQRGQLPTVQPASSPFVYGLRPRPAYMPVRKGERREERVCVSVCLRERERHMQRE